jgi:hypothetical protein
MVLIGYEENEDRADDPAGANGKYAVYEMVFHIYIVSTIKNAMYLAIESMENENNTTFQVDTSISFFSNIIRKCKDTAATHKINSISIGRKK